MCDNNLAEAKEVGGSTFKKNQPYIQNNVLSSLEVIPVP